MAKSETEASGRKVETGIEIQAPAEAVWKALTEAEELQNWFPFEAKVEPGEGGSIWLGWDEIATWDSTIEVWEPERHLRTTYAFPRAADEKERPPRLAVDYYLEGRGGGTYLRLVHSGFGSGEAWDEEYDGVRRGWAYELKSLRHYLERHRGTIRRVAWAFATLDIPWEEAWARLVSREGLTAEGSIEGLKEGDRYSIRLASGPKLTGVVQLVNAGMDFAGTVENLNDALFRASVEIAHKGGLSATMWISTYGISAEEVEALQNQLRALLQGLF